MEFATQPVTLTLNHPSLPTPITVKVSDVGTINWQAFFALFMQILPLILPFLTPTPAPVPAPAPK